MTVANTARVALRQTSSHASISRSVHHVSRQNFVTTRGAAPAATRSKLPTITATAWNAPHSSQFHTSLPLLKKGKGNSKNSRSEPAPPSPAASAAESSSGGGGGGGDGGNGPSPENILDFSDVDAAVEKHNSHFREQLRQQRAGGRFNPDAVGALLVTPDRKTAPDVKFPLKDLASVVPKGGRALAILAHEEGYIKPIMSAVQASEQFNQQPQRDPDNDLCLLLKIEAEPREEAVKRVKGICNEWRDRIRAARHKRDKLHKKWASDKVVLVDVKTRAGKELEKVIKGWMDKLDAAEKEAVNAAGK